MSLILGSGTSCKAQRRATRQHNNGSSCSDSSSMFGDNSDESGSNIKGADITKSRTVAAAAVAATASREANEDT
eukprot:19498-Heterococcus_DN1.PRE.1